MSSCLEWKHARTFVPKGNKRLTCLVDDLNLSRVSADGYHITCSYFLKLINNSKTKKITTVTVVWISVPNYHKILPTLALNFSENY